MTNLYQLVNKRNQEAVLVLLHKYHRYGASWSETQIDIDQYVQEGDLLLHEIESEDIVFTDPDLLTGELGAAWQAYVAWAEEMDREDEEND